MPQPKHVTTIYPDKTMWGGWHQRIGGNRLLVRVDAKYPTDVRPLVRYHEIREDHWMNDGGLPYEEAHRLANRDEKRKFGAARFRREIGATTRVLAKNRGNRNPQPKQVVTFTLEDLPQELRIEVRNTWARGYPGWSFKEWLQSRIGGQKIAQMRAEWERKHGLGSSLRQHGNPAADDSHIICDRCGARVYWNKSWGKPPGDDYICPDCQEEEEDTESGAREQNPAIDPTSPEADELARQARHGEIQPTGRCLLCGAKASRDTRWFCAECAGERLAALGRGLKAGALRAIVRHYPREYNPEKLCPKCGGVLHYIGTGGVPRMMKCQACGKVVWESRAKPAKNPTGGAFTVPSNLSVLGTLDKVDHTNGTWRPPRGKVAYLCTDASGRDLYVAFAQQGVHWQPWSGNGGGAVGMTKKFHGVSNPTQELKLEMDTTIPSRLKKLGEVKNILYTPLDPSPKASYSWTHEAGDLGPGKAQTSTALCCRLDGSGLFFIVQERDRGWPKVTERGIVGAWLLPTILAVAAILPTWSTYNG